MEKSDCNLVHSTPSMMFNSCWRRSNISAGPSRIMQIKDEYDCSKESIVHHFEGKSLI